MSKNKTGGLDQYGAGPFERQQCGTAGTEGVNGTNVHISYYTKTSTQSTGDCQHEYVGDVVGGMDLQTSWYIHHSCVVDHRCGYESDA